MPRCRGARSPAARSSSSTDGVALGSEASDPEHAAARGKRDRSATTRDDRKDVLGSLEERHEVLVAGSLRREPSEPARAKLARGAADRLRVELAHAIARPAGVAEMEAVIRAEGDHGAE